MRPDAYCIGADQTLTLEGRILHKSAISTRRRQTLAALSGRTHRLTSAFCVARAGQALVVDRDHADLTMRPLDPGEISRYLERAGPAVLASVGGVSGRGSRRSSLRSHRRRSFRCSRTADAGAPCLAAPRKSDLAMIGDDAPRAGVAGWPVEHSRSPMIHRYWLEGARACREATRDSPFAPENSAQFADEIGQGGLVGANVTVPHKEAAFSACDRRTPVAEALGAVNTLWRQDGLLMGRQHRRRRLSGQYGRKRPRLGGASGDWPSSSAPAAPPGRSSMRLISRGFERIAVVNRTQVRAEALAAHFGGPTTAIALGRSDGGAARARICSSTPVRSAWPDSRRSPSIWTACRTSAVVADIVYVPLRTPAHRGRGRAWLARRGGAWACCSIRPRRVSPAGSARSPTVTPALRALVEAEVLATHGGRR